eukprot:241093_1
MPQNSVRVHISDIPGFEDELKRLVNQLDEKHSVDYDNKPYKKSALYREWHRKHEQRKEYAHSVLGIPFVYPPCWFMLMSRLYDVLHFGLFGEQWKAIILEERDKIMWTGTYYLETELSLDIACVCSLGATAHYQCPTGDLHALLDKHSAIHGVHVYLFPIVFSGRDQQSIHRSFASRASKYVSLRLLSIQKRHHSV